MLRKKIIVLLLSSIICNQAMAFGLKDVYKNLHINNTTPGNYQNAAAGWYSGGSSVVRTKNTAIKPFSMTAPHLKTGCSGIDAFAGSFSMISGPEIVNIVENIGSQVGVYAFHLGMKTYAPQIETIMKDLRNLQMELNQFGIGHCKATQSLFAAALPQNTAMYEKVCEEMAEGGGNDLGGQRKKCKDYNRQKEAVKAAQDKDPEMLLDNYNLFVKAAKSVGIPTDLYSSLMSMTGTIMVKDGIMIPYPSLASDPQALGIQINGGSGASIYSCDSTSTCLSITVDNNVTISHKDSYAGKAKARLDALMMKMHEQKDEFDATEQGFLSSLGNSFPIFDHITLEVVSGITILDSSSQVIAKSILLSHLTSVINDIKKGIATLKQKQINDRYLVEYENSLNKLLKFANSEWSKVMTESDRINDRAEKIEKHLISRERG